MAHFTKMIDMARTPEKVPSPKQVTTAMAVNEVSGPKYPYGLCLRLDEETMEKLGMELGELPDIGSIIHLCAIAEVTSASANKSKREDGTEYQSCSIELQITHLATESEDEENEEMRRDRAYGSVDADKGDAQ